MIPHNYIVFDIDTWVQMNNGCDSKTCLEDRVKRMKCVLIDAFQGELWFVMPIKDMSKRHIFLFVEHSDTAHIIGSGGRNLDTIIESNNLRLGMKITVKDIIHYKKGAKNESTYKNGS